jgi:hypothetical protein
LAKRIPDLFISGHFHCYQHLIKDDGQSRSHYVIAGTGGYPSLYDTQRRDLEPIDNSAIDAVNHVRMKFSQKTYGYVRITVAREMLRSEFIAVPGGSFTIALEGS